MSDTKKRLNNKKQNKNVNIYDNDIELKEDCMDLIKAQNKKIQGLFSEIEKKDKLISQLQIQLKSYEEISVENNILKSQINSLNEDFELKIIQ